MRIRIFGMLILVWGLILILIPWVLFPVCGAGRFASSPGHPEKPHPCWPTAKAETVLGILSIGIGLIPLLKPTRKSILGASLSSIIISVLVVLFPGFITGLCKAPTMACRIGTLPALVGLAIIMLLTGLAGLAQYDS